MYDQYPDALSRRIWALALLATSAADTVVRHLLRIDVSLESLHSDAFHAVASTSSRIGIQQQDRHRLTPVWIHSSDFGPRTRLLLAHFTASIYDGDALPYLDNASVAALVTPNAFSWPIVRAVVTRMHRDPNPTLLDALTHFSPDSGSGFSLDVCPPEEHLNHALREPAWYPGAWVVSAERWRSAATDEPALERRVLAEEWIPKVPRM